MKVLIVELISTGHYTEYLKHIINGINEHPYKNEFLFYLNPKLKRLVEKTLISSKKVKVIYSSNEIIVELENCKSSFQQSSFYWSLISKIWKTEIFNHVLFLNINIVSRNKKVFIPFLRLPFTFSGIFFQSPYQLRGMGQSKYLKRIKRETLLRLLSWNKNCTRIFLLNDREGSTFYSKWSRKIGFIPDPINLVPASNLNIKHYHGIPKRNFVLVHIGALSIQKGSLDIINALETFYPLSFDDVSILFVGKMKANLVQKIESINSLFGKEVIIKRNEFITEEDFSAYLNQSDCILIANRNVEASSGILNHSLMRKKIVIAPNQGFYRSMLKDYDSAYLFDESCALETALKNSMEFKFSKETKNYFDEVKFYEKNSPKRFFNILMKFQPTKSIV